MMEFVLVVPIYILLFGGVFWVGELLVTQLMRQNSMRSTAWSYGVREDRPDSSKVLGVLSNRPLVNNWTLETTFSSAVKRGRYLADTAQSWLQVVGGSFDVDYRPSPWTYGWFNSAQVMQHIGSGSDNMNERLKDKTKKYEHIVVMRTKGGADINSIRRRWTAQGAPHLGDKGLVPVVNAEWRKVTMPVLGNGGEVFPYDSGRPTLATGEDNFGYEVPQNKDYQRFVLLYSWGNHRGFQFWDMGLDAIDMVSDGISSF